MSKKLPTGRTASGNFDPITFTDDEITENINGTAVAADLMMTYSNEAA